MPVHTQPNRSFHLRRIALIAVLVSGCAAGEETATSTSVTTTVVTTSTTAEAQQVADLPRSGCCDGVEIAVGTYRLPTYWGVPLTVQVGEGWRAVYDNSAVLMAFVQGQNEADDPSRWLYLIRSPEELNPEDVIAAMAGMDSITVTSGPDDVEYAGFTGKQFDATAHEDPDQTEVPANGIEAGAIRLEALNDTGYFTTGFFVTSATRESSLRFVALDVSERTLLALIDAPPGEFGAFSEDAMAILASLAVEAQG